MITEIEKRAEFNKLSKYLGVSSDELVRLGIFDLALPFDNHYFVDVFYMKDTNIPEFANSYNDFLRHFALLGEFLRNSRVKGDKAWAAAERMLHFREEPGFHLGYSKTQGKGSGVGRKFSRQLVASAKEILDLGINEPEAYFFIPFIEAGIGCDRISDMACSILRLNFAKYTQRMSLALKVENLERFYIDGEDFFLPKSPSNPARPLLMVPKSFLRRLPLQFSWTDVFDYYSLNQSYRNRVNSELSKIIGVRETFNKDNVKKKHLKQILSTEKGLFKSIVDDFANQLPVDIEMKKVAKELCLLNPLDLSFKDENNSTLLIVRRICEQFQFLIEKKGAWKSLYKDGFPLHESYAQTLFYSVAYAYCEANRIDLLPEVETGRGRVDFRMNGAGKKVMVEMKLSTHGRLLHGYTSQILEYLEADESDHCIYLIVKVFDFGSSKELDSRERDEEILKLRKKMDAKVGNVQKLYEEELPEKIILSVVDGTFRESASISH